MDDTGKIVREMKVASEPAALQAVLKNPAYDFKRIGLEAGPLSQWLFSALAEAAVGRTPQTWRKYEQTGEGHAPYPWCGLSRGIA